MDFKTCLAAALLLAATFLPWALSLQAAPARARCEDAGLQEVVDPLALRGSLPVVRCAQGTGSAEPRGAAGLLLGRRIDINDATADELRALPGVGPGRAAAIARERSAGGPFRSVDDLRRVRGLGGKRIRSLAAWATVGDRGPSGM